MKKNKNTLKRILSLVGKYPLSVIAVILFAAAEVAATLYVPILVGDGVDLIAGKGAVDFDGLSAVFLKLALRSPWDSLPNGWWGFSITALRFTWCRISATRRSTRSRRCP